MTIIKVAISIANGCCAIRVIVYRQCMQVVAWSAFAIRGVEFLLIAIAVGKQIGCIVDSIYIQRVRHWMGGLWHFRNQIGGRVREMVAVTRVHFLVTDIILIVGNTMIRNSRGIRETNTID